MVVVDLTGRPRFFIETVVALIVGLVIDKVILTGVDIAVDFFRLFLW